MTDNKDMPEEIWAEWCHAELIYAYKEENPETEAKYIRADKYEALQKQNEIMREVLEIIAIDLLGDGLNRSISDRGINKLVNKSLDEVK